MKTNRFALVALVAVGGAACYTYAPATLETVPEGARVKALISTEAQLDLERRAGIEARELEGELVERSDERILLSVRVPPPPTGLSSGRPLRQRIDLAPRDVLRVDVRKVDGARTALFAGGVAGFAAILIAVAVSASNPGDPPNGGPPPPESVVGWLIGIPVVEF